MAVPYHKPLDGRYWVFKGEVEWPAGGLADFVGAYHTEEGVQEALGPGLLPDTWAQVLDMGVSDPDKPWMNIPATIRTLKGGGPAGWIDVDKGPGILVTLDD